MGVQEFNLFHTEMFYEEELMDIVSLISQIYQRSQVIEVIKPYMFSL